MANDQGIIIFEDHAHLRTLFSRLTFCFLIANHKHKRPATILGTLMEDEVQTTELWSQSSNLENSVKNIELVFFLNINQLCESILSPDS